jgi:hypothetical protein
VAFSDHTAAILVIGALVPLVGYAIKNGLPTVKEAGEEFKAVLHVVLAAVGPSVRRGGRTSKEAVIRTMV